MPADPVSLLQHLIRIPSVNPEDAPGMERVGEAETGKLRA
jgi:acetylornithine deacetylase/succinyl-diaminopimelate desuccinylase-like protein